LPLSKPFPVYLPVRFCFRRETPPPVLVPKVFLAFCSAYFPPLPAFFLFPGPSKMSSHPPSFPHRIFSTVILWSCRIATSLYPFFGPTFVSAPFTTLTSPVPFYLIAGPNKPPLPFLLFPSSLVFYVYLAILLFGPSFFSTPFFFPCARNVFTNLLWFCSSPPHAPTKKPLFFNETGAFFAQLRLRWSDNGRALPPQILSRGLRPRLGSPDIVVLSFFFFPLRVATDVGGLFYFLNILGCAPFPKRICLPF